MCVPLADLSLDLEDSKAWCKQIEDLLKMLYYSVSFLIEETKMRK